MEFQILMNQMNQPYTEMNIQHEIKNVLIEEIIEKALKNILTEKIFLRKMNQCEQHS